MAVDEININLDGTGHHIGIAVARFNEYAGKEEYEACVKELLKLGVDEECITKVTVPGALELPQVLARMAESGIYDALIALGAVIKGETYHFEVVSNESAAGLARVSLDYKIPVANGVLTCYSDEQCKERTAMKGVDCARCAVEMANFSDLFPTDDEAMADFYDEDEEGDEQDE